MMSEVRNIRAKCVELNDTAPIVLHQIDYEVKDSGVWLTKSVQVMAKDPMDAIDYIKRVGGY
jgi:hypothetical protein